MSLQNGVSLQHSPSSCCGLLWSLLLLLLNRARSMSSTRSSTERGKSLVREAVVGAEGGCTDVWREVLPEPGCGCGVGLEWELEA